MGSCSHRHAEPFTIDSDNKKQEIEVMFSFTTRTLFCLKTALHQQSAFTKTSTPMGAQMDASIFSTYPVWGLSVKMTNALVDNQEHWPCSFVSLWTTSFPVCIIRFALCLFLMPIFIWQKHHQLYSQETLYWKKEFFIFLAWKAKMLLKRCCMYGLVMFVV